MCPDVSRLRVDSEDALEAGAERRHGRPVAVQQEVVVLQPIGQHIVRYDAPPALPHLVYKLLHPLHGMVSLQQRSHPHETFVAAPLFLFFLLLLSFFSSVILFVFSSLLVLLWDPPIVRGALCGAEVTVWRI